MPGLSIRLRKVRQESIRSAASELGISVSSFIAEAIGKGLSGEIVVHIRTAEKGEVRISTIVSSHTKTKIEEIAGSDGVRPTEWVAFASISYSELVISGKESSNDESVDLAFRPTELESNGMSYRRQQHALARSIHNHLSTGVIGLCEAGTGTGKAYACLSAAAAYSIDTGQKVVVATFTRALQKQLGETAKTVNSVSGLNAKIATMYGKRNYVSPVHLKLVMGDKDIHIADSDRMTVRQWMTETRDWLMVDLEAVVDQDTFPLRLVAIPDDCTDEGALIHYRQAAANAADADVIITSHHMLLYSMMNKGGSGLLGFKPENIIIDEAHLLEQAAGSVFGSQISFASSKWAAMKLIASLSEQKKAPLAGKFRKWIMHLEHFAEQVNNSASNEDEEVISLVRRSGISKVLSSEAKSLEILSKVPRIPKTVTMTGTEKHSYYEIKDAASIFAQMKKAIDDPTHYGSDIYATLSPVKKYVRIVATSRWFIGRDIDRVLWEKVRSASLISATIYLPISNGEESPTEFINSVGLKKHTINAEPAFYESWIYDNLSIYTAPENFPEPVSEDVKKRKGQDRDKWLDNTSAIINNLNHIPVSEEHGGILVLCTGYADAEAIMKRLKKGNRQIIQYKRGDDMRSIQKQFIDADGKAVLVGLGGFWTGVDFPGRILTDCVITRMPVMSGSDPMLLSRFQYVKEKTGVPVAFATILLPRMGRMLRQGIGRVIRRKSDRGRIFITDPRIHTRPKWRLRTLLRRYEPLIKIDKELYQEVKNGK